MSVCSTRLFDLFPLKPVLQSGHYLLIDILKTGIKVKCCLFSNYDNEREKGSISKMFICSTVHSRVSVIQVKLPFDCIMERRIYIISSNYLRN